MVNRRRGRPKKKPPQKPAVNCLALFGTHIPKPGDTYQAPYHQQESMVELSDDTSPNTPLISTSGGWKPIQPATSTQGGTPEIKITRQEQIWHEFKDGLNTKPIHNIGEKTKEVKTNQVKLPPKPEIKWELNELDGKEESTENVIKKDEPPLPTLPPHPPKPHWRRSEYDHGLCKQVVYTTKPEIILAPKNKRPAAAKVQKFDEPTYTNNATLVNPSPPSQSQKQGKPTDPVIATVNMMYSLGSYPKGIPRSFVQQQIQEKIQQQLEAKTESQTRNLSSSPGWNPNIYEELQVHTNPPALSPTEEQQYSPSDVYDDLHIDPADDGSVSPEEGQKRLSAFRRLGPVSQPKKPKLTINLLCNKEQSVRREVLEDEVETYTPVHLRKDVIESSDETVIKYLAQWPWKRNVGVRKTVTVRNSKSVMILEQEQMEEVYEKDNVFIQVVVHGYPRHWKKEHVLDVILDCVKGKSFIPSFVEFTQEECKFLVIRSRQALVSIHKVGFYIREEDVQLQVSISQVDLSLKQIDFIPRLVLRKQLAAGYDGERKLSLKEFTLKSDVSHFIYFPLNRVTNQTELVQLQSIVAWNYLTDLDLSHNRITSIDGFELPKTTPKLKHLDLSFNWLSRVSSLLYNRELSLRSLKLEGNPLCHDYTDPGLYVRVLKMIFPGLTEIDGVPIHLKGDLPKMKRNFCPEDATEIAGKFLEVFFPLLEASHDDRYRIEELYNEKAVLTVTYRYGLRYNPIHRKFRNIFLRARVFDEGDAECIEGASAITKLLCKWPMLEHDPYTFTVDVLHHNDDSTILRVDGVLKLTSDTLAEDEHLLAFARTLVLTTSDGVEYKILNEMVYWDEPTNEMANTAFKYNTVRSSKRLSLKLDHPPDKELKRNLTEIFMQITEAGEHTSERCLEQKEWNLKSSIEYYMKLVKLDDLTSLRRELEMDKDIK